MQIADLKAQLKSGMLMGVYIFCGEENFLKRHYMGEVRAAILTEPAFDAFNRMVFEGEKVDFARLSEAVKAPPMMAERKLVEWHLADFSAMREGDMEKLKREISAECRAMNIGLSMGSQWRDRSIRPEEMYHAADASMREHKAAYYSTRNIVQK